jgi:hypothetical protein
LVIEGTVCWGHQTGVTENNTREFAYNWSGSGTWQGTGDDEVLKLAPTQYMESEAVWIDIGQMVGIRQNKYITGDSGILKYRTNLDYMTLIGMSWTDYTVPFVSAGYIQVRVEG